MNNDFHRPVANPGIAAGQEENCASETRPEVTRQAALRQQSGAGRDSLITLLLDCKELLRMSRNHTVNVGDCGTCKLIDRIDAALKERTE